MHSIKTQMLPLAWLALAATAPAQEPMIIQSASASGTVTTPTQTSSGAQIPLRVSVPGATADANVTDGAPANATCSVVVNTNGGRASATATSTVQCTFTAATATYVNIRASSFENPNQGASTSLTGSVTYGGTTVAFGQSVEIASGYYLDNGQSITVSLTASASCTMPMQAGSASLSIHLSTVSLAISDIPGLRPARPGLLSPHSSPAQPGRLFVNTADAGSILGVSTEKQHTTIEVVWRHVLGKYASAIVRWELYDPDDPATSKILDTNDHAADNTGSPEAAATWLSHVDPSVGTPPVNVVSGPLDPDLGYLIGTAESVSGGSSSEPIQSRIRLNYSSDGGDNFRIRVRLLRDFDRAPLAECQGETMTVWRFREVRVYAMDSAGLFPGDYDPRMDQATAHRFFANPDPNLNAYIDMKVVQEPRRPFANVPAADIPTFMDVTVGYLDSPGRMSLLGTGDAAYGGYSLFYPHAVVNVHQFRPWWGSGSSGDAAKQQCSRTSGHEVGHLLLGPAESGTDFHIRHTTGTQHPGAGDHCLFNQLTDSLLTRAFLWLDPRDDFICERHIGMLRDACSLHAVGHDLARAMPDSVRSR